ncbi:MAG: hypothetical protein IT320_14260 [Anaerolineae bacterium]|nr:hypothetical protein [Anaerolineae bacterium]
MPAETPAQLATTPGAPAVIDTDTYSTDVFSAPIPEGWRVITGSALFPQSVTLVAPGDCMLIVIGLEASADAPSAPNCADQEARTWREVVTEDDTTVYLAGVAPAANGAEFEPLWTALTGGITIHDSSQG